MRHAFPSNIAAHWQSPPSAHVPWCEHRSHESRTPLVAAVDRSTVRVSARNASSSSKASTDVETSSTALVRSSSCRSSSRSARPARDASLMSTTVPTPCLSGSCSPLGGGCQTSRGSAAPSRAPRAGFKPLASSANFAAGSSASPKRENERSLSSFESPSVSRADTPRAAIEVRSRCAASRAACARCAKPPAASAARSTPERSDASEKDASSAPRPWWRAPAPPRAPRSAESCSVSTIGSTTSCIHALAVVSMASSMACPNDASCARSWRSPEPTRCVALSCARYRSRRPCAPWSPPPARARAK